MNNLNSVYLRMCFARYRFTIVAAVLILVLGVVGTQVGYAQGQWTKSAGIKVKSDCKLVAHHSVSLLYSQQEVYLSDNGGFMWWSISDKLPQGLISACATSHSVIGLSMQSDRTVRMHTTTDGGTTWNWKAAFTLDPGQDIVELCSEREMLYAYTKQGIVFTSPNGGETWLRTKVAQQVGDLQDLALTSTVWVACGTQATMWSADAGITWSKSAIPVQAGGLLNAVEVHNDEVWGAGGFGAVRFDLSSRSWIQASHGLSASPEKLPAVVDLKELAGVLFGLFRMPTNANACFWWNGSAWVAADNGGLPYGEQISRFRFGVWRDLLQVYSNSSDPNMRGVYVVRHTAPTSVNNGTPQHTEPPLHLGPIPATDHLLIQSPTGEGVSVTVFDAVGSIVHSITVNGSALLPTTSFPSGTYVLVLSTGTHTFSRVITVQH